MSQTRLKLTAWIAAAALLFSALSPAMASALFANRPDILARVLGVPMQHAAAQAGSEPDDGCPHETASAAHHGATSPQGDDTSDHAAHGIYCSFCLASGATVTVLGTARPPAMLVPSVVEILPSLRSQPVVARLPSTHRSRAPPVLS